MWWVLPCIHMNVFPIWSYFIISTSCLCTACILAHPISLHPLHRSLPNCGEGTCITRRSHEPCSYVAVWCCHLWPKTDGSKQRVLKKWDPLEEEMANHLSILVVRPQKLYKRTKRYDTERWVPRSEGVPCAPGKRGGELPVAPEWMKWLGQSRYDTQLLKCLVTNIKSDAAKNIPGQQTKMDGNGWILFRWPFIYYCGQESHRRNTILLNQQKSQKYSTWVQPQKWQNNLGSFPKQAIQHHSNPS